ncbi:MAG: bifunctional diguanylate cyclase/phosphodiesterase [Actinocatenispora sp.]
MTAVSRVLRHDAWHPLARVLVISVPALYLWAAGAVLAGVIPVRAALVVSAGATGLAFTVLLVHLALVLPHGACRGAGFLGMGVLSGSVGIVSASLLPPDWAVRALTGGFTASAVLHLLGLLLLPGTTASWRARLRRLLDGFGIGISLFFAAWLLVIVPLAGSGPGPVGSRALLAVVVWLIASGALTCAALISLRAFRYRRSAMFCGGGVMLALSGQALLLVLLLVGADPAYLLGALAGPVLGPVVLWLGARHNGVRTAVPHPSEETGTFAGMPLLSVPVALAVVGAVYHLVTVGAFGSYSAGLGVLVVVAVAVREIFAVFDVRRYAGELARQEARFRSIVAGSSDVTMLLDERLVVRWQSPAAARQLGLSDAEVLGRLFSSLFHHEDAPGLAEQLRGLLIDPPDRPVLAAARIRDGFGRWRHTESTAVDHRSEPSVAGLVVHIRDVGDRREMERTLHRMAFTDPLTGLPNRRALLRALAELRERPGPDAWRGSVMVIDLDGLKAVNDGFGHEVGDAVLVEVARRLRDGLAPDHVAARLGGDEFAVLTGESQNAARTRATRLLTALAEPYELAGGRTLLSANIGIAEFAPGATPDEMLAGADLAMRRARQRGQGRVERYDETLEFQLLRRGLLEGELRGADQRGELDLVYQPIVSVTDRRAVAVEALLRWRHPQLGTVPPSEFVPIAEAAGLIADIGGWVLHQACRRLSAWLAEGRDLQVAVNLSAAQLYQPDFVAQVAAVLDAYEIPPNRLIVEVTEAIVVRDVQHAVTRLAGLRSLGVRTALDDFGSGHASLTYLRRLPIDVLKVDRALVAEPATGQDNSVAPLTDVVVRLGQRLGMLVVAEGVETEEQLTALRAAGCGFAQGYLFSRPVPAEHVEAFCDAGSDGDGPIITS